MCEVSLPNKEISFVVAKEALKKLDTMITQSTAISIQEAVFSEENEKLKDLLQVLLLQSVNFYNAKSELLCHGLVLGLCALLGNAYAIFEMKFCDRKCSIKLMPKNCKLPGIEIELRSENDCSESDLKKLAEEALGQINENILIQETDSTQRVSLVYDYGTAFCGKDVEVAVKERNISGIYKIVRKNNS